MKKIYLVLIAVAFLAISPFIALAASTDLIMNGISVSPGNPTIGQQATVTFWGKNNGDQTLYDNKGLSNVGFSIPDFSGTNFWSLVGAKPDPSVDPLGPGETFSYSYVGSFNTNGDKSVYLKTDNANELAESNEYNNIITGTITVGTKSASTDVIINSVVITPAKPVVGQPVTITVNGRYVGDISITDGAAIGGVGFFHSSFKTSGTSVLSPVPSISSPLVSGSHFTYTISGYFTDSGTKLLVFDVDNSNLLAETNEVNNSYSKTVTVLHDGDLVKVENRFEIYIVKADGQKHSFVNGPTFWSYYTGSWSQLYRDGVPAYIKTITQTEFDQLQYGSHMTMKPGSKLIKFKSSSQIFAVYNENKIKAVTDSEATNWYGASSNWRKTVIVIQDSLAADYIQDDYNFIDSDSDGVSNVDETNIYKTNSNNADTDGDDYRDGWEIINGFNPNGPGRL